MRNSKNTLPFPLPARQVVVLFWQLLGTVFTSLLPSCAELLPDLDRSDPVLTEIMAKLFIHPSWLRFRTLSPLAEPYGSPLVLWALQRQSQVPETPV